MKRSEYQLWKQGRPEVVHVTLIDDDTICHFIFQQLMKLLKPGYTIECFKDPLEALKKIEQGTFRSLVMLLDINMPQLSGLDLLKAMREKHCTVPVYILSSSDSATDRRRAAEFKNVMGYFVKPLTTAYVTEIWNRHFEPTP